jgi:hypothetical protein
VTESNQSNVTLKEKTRKPNAPVKSNFWEGAKSWIIRFIKFNLVGFIVFLIGTAIYAAAFSYMGFWTWIAANSVGSIFQFSLINWLNKTKKGRIFDSCQNNTQP